MRIIVRTLCFLALLLPMVSFAQTPTGASAVSPVQRVKDYEESLNVFAKWPASDDNNDIRKHVYSNFYQYTRDNPAVVRFRFVYPDVDDYDLRDLSKAGIVDIKGYLDEIWYLATQQKTYIKSIEYSISDILFFAEDSASLVFKKNVVLDDRGTRKTYALLENFHLRFNKPIKEWEIERISYYGTAVFDEPVSGGYAQTATDTKAEERPLDQDSLIVDVKGVKFKMIRVKGGLFEMGCDGKGPRCRSNEKPQHRVSLDDYYIAETEVTQELWNALMGTNPSYNKGNNLPVENVSYNEVKEFLILLRSYTKLAFRLPTEAEWEYAARGGAKGIANQPIGGIDVPKTAWVKENSEEKSHSVKSLSPNELGLYDMLGNVWEWCADGYTRYSELIESNPLHTITFGLCVIRGGCFLTRESDCSMSQRASEKASNYNYLLGFRVAIGL